MRKIISAVMALLLVLGICTSCTLATTAPSGSTTLPVTSQEINLNSAENKKYKDLITEYFNHSSEPQTSFAITEDSSILSKNNSLFLKTGDTETLLIEGNESEGIEWENVRFYEKINDDRFIYYIGGFEWTAGCGVYDIKEMKDYRFDDVARIPLTVAENHLFSIGNTLYGGYTGIFDLAKTDLTTHKTEKLLTNIPEQKLKKLWNYAMSDDGKIFAMVFGLTGDDTYDIELFDTTTGESLDTFAAFDYILSVSTNEFLCFEYFEYNESSTAILLKVNSYS